MSFDCQLLHLLQLGCHVGTHSNFSELGLKHYTMSCTLQPLPKVKTRARARVCMFVYVCIIMFV